MSDVKELFDVQGFDELPHALARGENIEELTFYSSQRHK